MADDNKSGWGRVFDELKNPWDWTAAIVGGAGGALVTIFTHGLDLGHSIPTGALGAVAARRAVSASFHRPSLRKKAKRLLKILKDENRHPDLADRLQDYSQKWEMQIMPDDKFDAKVAEVSEEDSSRKWKKPKQP